MFETWNIEITRRCDLSCRHCIVGNSTNEYGVIEGNLHHVFDAISHMGGKNVSFTGGEPFMVPNLVTASNYAKSLGLKLSLITNGQIASKLNPNTIARTFETIGVSIDGTEEIHDYVRGDGSYVKATDFIRNLVRCDACVIAYIVVNNLNLFQIGKVLNNLIDLGICTFHINQINVQGNATEHIALHLNRPLDEIKQLVFNQLSEIIEVGELIASTSCDIGAHSLYLDRFGNIHSCAELGLSSLPPITSLFSESVVQDLNKFFDNFTPPPRCAYEMHRGKGLVLEFNLDNCPILTNVGERDD